VASIGTTWKPVTEKISGTKHDVEEMIYCYMLERNTATVFHAMRIAERGLRRLAKTLRVALIHHGNAQAVEFADWEKIITGIKGKIDVARRSLPPGSRREKRLMMYSDAADHCVFMKDIWRNNVSHTRKPYNASEALGVIERVRDFMIFLVGKPNASK